MFCRNNTWAVSFLACLFAISPIFAQDPYQDWLSFEAPFASQRSLTSAEKLWLAQLSAGVDVEVVSAETVPSIWFPSLTKSTDLPVFSPSQNSEVDRTFNAPRTRLTYLEADYPIRIQIAGQSIALPELDGFHDAKGFVGTLQYWLGRDLSGLIFLTRKAQQETGWSDYELMQLVRLYSRTALSGSDSLALQTAYWHQTGYRVQLARTDDQWVLLLALNDPVDQEKLFRHGGLWWLPTETVESSTLNLLATQADLNAQPLRLTSMNDRSRSSDFTSHEFWFENAEKLLSVRWELPTHWAQIRWHGKDTAGYFSELLPAYLVDQINGLMRNEPLLTKLDLLSNWLSEEYDDSEIALSLQQALFYRQMTPQNRYQFVSRWWREEARGSIALVRISDETLLALSLPSDLDEERSIEHRRKRWLLLNSELVIVSPDQIDGELLWRFIP